MINFFNILWRANNFSKFFRYVNVSCVNYGQEIQIRACLMTDTIHKKRPIEFFNDFRVKLTVFTAENNYFRKNFVDFLRLAFISYTFRSPMTYCPQSKIQLAFRRCKRT